MFPIAPQPMTRLRKRYPKALEKTWDCLEIARHPTDDRPGLHRRYIFDTADGWRLIISRDCVTSLCEVFIHFSASVWLETKKLHSSSEMVEEAFDRFRDISGWQGKVIFVGFSGPSGIPHFLIPAEKYDAQTSSKSRRKTFHSNPQD